MTTATAKKPRVIGIVILSILGGLLNLAAGFFLVTQRQSTLAAAGVPTWLGYVSIVMGALELLAAVLIATYKRAGLMLGLAIYGLNLVLNLINVVTGQGLNIFLRNFPIP